LNGGRLTYPAVLQKTLNASPTGDLAFIYGANGRPLTKETFGNYFREAANAANAKATVAQFKALFG